MARVYCASIEKGSAKTGAPFIKATCYLEDHSQRTFYVWENVDQFEQFYADGTRVLECMFGGDANFPKISAFEPAVGDVTEFISFIYQNDEQANNTVNQLKSYVTRPCLKLIVDFIFNQPGPATYPTVQSAFAVIPAAKSFHHEFRYGLVKHTHEVMTFINRVCSADLFGNRMDKELCLCAGLLHDVGKVYEYSFNEVTASYGTDYQVNQIFLGSHLSRGAEMVATAWYAICNKAKNDPVFFLSDGTQITFSPTEFDHMQVEHLKHCILAHHLQREWGAIPKAPQTLEAYLVFLADYFSAAFGKYCHIDWSNCSINSLYGETSKYDSFFGFSEVLRQNGII